MKRCATCHRIAGLSTLRAGGDIFCSAYCMTYSTMPGFCASCAAQTSPVAPGSTTMSHFGGSMLLGSRDRCPTCHSIVQRKVYFALLVPVWWRSRYRVIYTSRTSYVGRLIVGRPEDPIVPS